MNIKNRIKEFKWVDTDQLKDNPKNWRVHSEGQKNALTTLLDTIGWGNAILVREDENNNLNIIDGHLRKDLAQDSKIPVLVLDVSEEEADLMLATIDPLSRMADTDAENLRSLIEELSYSVDNNVREVLAQIETLYDVGIPEPFMLDDTDDPIPGEPYVVISFRMSRGEYERKEEIIEQVIDLLGLQPNIEEIG
jgi:hypothetical protein